MQLRRLRAAPKPLDTAANAVWYCCRRRTFVTRPTRLTIDFTSMAVGQSGGDAQGCWAVNQSKEHSR